MTCESPYWLLGTLHHTFWTIVQLYGNIRCSYRLCGVLNMWSRRNVGSRVGFAVTSP